MQAYRGKSSFVLKLPVMMHSLPTQISSFAKELLNFKKEMSHCKDIVKSIGTDEEMTALQANTLKYSRKLQEFQDCQTVIIASPSQRHCLKILMVLMDDVRMHTLM